jgi:transposase
LAHSITLAADQRHTLLRYYRSSSDPRLRLRAHILLLLDDGLPWATICAVLFCSSRTVLRWQERFQQGGLAVLAGQRPGPVPRRASWAAVVIGWVKQSLPRAFGFLRSRWCCETLVLLLWRLHQVLVSRETVRRWLHEADLVWRRPRPVLKRTDPQKEAKVAALRQLLVELPDDETAVFTDEVDVALNPKIGCMWMPKGRQAEVVTPGDNAKCYLAGSLHWRTGRLIQTIGPKRDGTLFVAHLEELCRRLRRYRKIHIICDNAKYHSCWAVCEFYAHHEDRIEFHFLPKYAPECNPIERVWWRLHEAITRNHQCRDLQELVELVLAWLMDKQRFRVQDSVYQPQGKTA